MADILLVAATPKEVLFLDGIKSSTPAGMLVKPGGGRRHNLTVLLTGPGIVSTTYHLTKTLLKHRFDLVVNLGIGGSTGPALKPVKLVNIKSDVFADFGIEDRKKFVDIFDAGLIKPNSVPFRNRMVHSTFKKKLQCLSAIDECEGITVQKVTGSRESAARVRKKHKRSIESMEGAAFFYVCNAEKIPCLQIRAVSNMVEERNRKNWKIDEAVDALAGFTGLMLLELETVTL